jgi:hypothetical protein
MRQSLRVMSCFLPLIVTLCGIGNEPGTLMSMRLDDSCYTDVFGLLYLGQSAAVTPAALVQGSSHQTATSALAARAHHLFIYGGLQSDR